MFRSCEKVVARSTASSRGRQEMHELVSRHLQVFSDQLGNGCTSECVGVRFGIVQVSLALVHVTVHLAKFRALEG